jgi:hypothetical protein
LLLPFAAQQTLKSANTTQRASFDVTLAADVVPGYYNLRVVTEGGVSLPVIIGVDRLPQQPLAATTAALPAALHGNVGGSQIAETTIQGTAGQKLLVDVEAQRLGGALRPVVHLYDAKRRQIAWSWNLPALGGDTRLEATLPEAGTYAIALHDSEYGTPGPGVYRMKIGQWSHRSDIPERHRRRPAGCAGTARLVSFRNSTCRPLPRRACSRWFGRAIRCGAVRGPGSTFLRSQS